MSWFTSTQLDSLDNLFIDQLEDLYDAEKRLVEARTRRWRTPRIRRN